VQTVWYAATFAVSDSPVVEGERSPYADLLLRNDDRLAGVDDVGVHYCTVRKPDLRLRRTLVLADGRALDAERSYSRPRTSDLSILIHSAATGKDVGVPVGAGSAVPLSNQESSSVSLTSKTRTRLTVSSHAPDRVVSR